MSRAPALLPSSASDDPGVGTAGGAARLAGLLDRIAARPGAVGALVIAITLVRLLGAAGAIDPLAGPDTGSYLAAAHDLADRGLLAHHVPNLPYWPAGYPTFLALLFTAFGSSLRLVAAAQVLLLGGATWCLFTLVRRELDATVALVAVLLTGISPALFASANELMYESVLASALIVAFELVSRARHTRGRRSTALAASGALVLGLAATMQPKALVVVFVLLAWLCVGRRPAGGTLVAVVLAAAVGPFALAARTDATAGHLALSANLGATARIGLNDHATGGYRYDVGVLRGCDLPPRLVSRDRVGFSDDDLFRFDQTLTRCSATWAVDHPVRALRLGATKAVDFWSPMVGPLVRDRDATWAQPFDYRRLTPSGVRASSAFAFVNRALGNLWMLWSVGLVLAGVVVGVRSSRRATTLILAAPVALFLLVSMVTIGDARFRLPVMPLATVLQALAVVALLRRGTRRWSPSSSRRG